MGSGTNWLWLAGGGWGGAGGLWLGLVGGLAGDSNCNLELKEG